MILSSPLVSDLPASALGDSEGLAVGDAVSNGLGVGDASALGDAGLVVGDVVEGVAAVVVGDEAAEVVVLGC